MLWRDQSAEHRESRERSVGVIASGTQPLALNIFSDRVIVADRRVVYSIVDRSVTHRERVTIMARGPLRLTRAGTSAPLKPPGPGTLDYALRGVRGGKQSVMELAPLAVRFEPRVERIVALWRQFTPWQRRTITLDEIVTLGALTPGEFLAAIVRAGFEFNDEITPLLIAAAFPEVIQRGVKRALRPSGFEDRHLLMQYIASASNARRRPLSDVRT